MTEHGDRLREAFTKHENETPDPAAVYARVEELARKYKWRRRGAQAAGGVALSAGLIAGITQLPSVLPADPAATSTFQFAAPSVAPTLDPSTQLSEKEAEEGLAAYFRAGYGYDDAVALARLWKFGADQIDQVKAVAGRKLLFGESLPVQPGQNPDTPATDDPATNERSKQFAMFFGSGYDWDDAVELAKLWKLEDPVDAKIEGGKRLLAGESLPIKPDNEVSDQALADLFWGAGYDSADAEKLAVLWKLDDTYAAKVEAGRRLRDGETIPIKP